MIDVVGFDPRGADEADLAGHYRVTRAAHLVDEPGRPAPSCGDEVDRLREPFPGLGPAGHWIARDGDGIVAHGYARFPEGDNGHLAIATVVVHPEHRRRGVGTAVLRETVPQLRAEGRAVVEDWRLADGSAGAEWARGLGFRVVRSVAVQELVVPEADRGRWAEELPAGYRVVRWTGAAPDDVVASYAAARAAIHDAPTGTTVFRPPEWTVGRVRATEAEMLGQGVEQRGDTAVLAAHRGRGLGLALKGVMAGGRAPGPGAHEHGHGGRQRAHLRVNEAFGLRTTAVELVVAQEVEALAARLGG
ncbi:GNAT family N-acetyltransferase [Saccharothrix sp. BKS2]|uniref:GNAT family N-acetyltransferase n=1 Tax=Saccharothrix sp. BKS2 TaxID=3064400 RepID=UPI0039EA843B